LRFLIRVENDNKSKHVITKQREIQGLVHKGKVGNLRITSKALEFDLFVKNENELHEVENIFSKSAKILTVKKLDIAPMALSKAQTMIEAKNLFNDERYWECHEILEGLWRVLKGDEKILVQAMILVCASFVHFQRNETAVAISMLQRYRSRLKWPDEFYEGVDMQKLRDGVAEFLLEESFRRIHL